MLTCRIHFNRKFHLICIIVWLVTFSVFAEKTPKGVALVRQELPELLDAFQSSVSPEDLDAIFGGWTQSDVEEFRHKNHGLSKVIAEHEGVWTAEQTIAIQEKYGRLLLARVGEVWGVARMRSQIEPPLQMAHESRLNGATKRGGLVDGMVFEIKGSRLIIHDLIESKMGRSTYVADQPVGFLRNIRSHGMTLSGQRFAPENIILREGQKNIPLISATDDSLAKVKVHLVTQNPKEDIEVIPLLFPVPRDQVGNALNLYFGRLTKLRPKERERYLAFFRRIERRRKRITELADLLGKRTNPFHTLFRDDAVSNRDYNGLTQGNVEPVHKISGAILVGKMVLPKEYQGLGFDQRSYLDADDVEAHRMAEPIRQVRQQRLAMIENRRRRIIELAELFGKKGKTFLRLFKEGAVSSGDLKNLTDGHTEPVHRVSGAILAGKMSLPEEFQGSGFDLVTYIDADDSLAQTLKSPILRIRPQDARVIENRRRRIMELADLFGLRGENFHMLFRKREVGTRDYKGITGGYVEPVHTISRIILAGKMQLPEEFEGTGFDPIAYLDADDSSARRLAEPILTLRPQGKRVIENRRKRIAELGELFGRKEHSFHTLFKGVQIGKLAYRDLIRGNIEPLHEVSAAILAGKMVLPEEFSDSHFDSRAYLDANDRQARVMCQPILQIRRQNLLVTENRRKRITELGELLGRRGETFHNLFRDGAVGERDYSSLTQGITVSVKKISTAILADKMQLPEEFDGLGFEHKAYLDADDKTVPRLAEPILRIRPLDRKVIENRRKRIRELGELFGKSWSLFHTLFEEGAVGRSDYRTLMEGGVEAVHTISHAILADKTLLPEEFDGLGFDPKAYLDANNASARSMAAPLKRVHQQNTAAIEGRRKRILELADLFGKRWAAFPSLFEEGAVRKSDYKSLVGGFVEPVHRVFRAILEGRTLVPPEWQAKRLNPIKFVEGGDGFDHLRTSAPSRSFGVKCGKAYVPLAR